MKFYLGAGLIQFNPLVLLAIIAYIVLFILYFDDDDGQLSGVPARR